MDTKFFDDEINKLKSDNMFRQIRNICAKEGKYITIDDKKYLNLSSNDYLGLSTDKNLVEEFLNQTKDSKEFLFSSASARLLTGSSTVYTKLELKIASLYSKEAALLFNTGYQCNLGVVSALMGKGDVIFCDKLNHASIIDGIKLSGADFHRYRHLDYEHLEELLKKHRSSHKKAIIISESVFSMDGDIADINRLVELKKRYGTLLMIDEAHAAGIFGDNLCGVAQEQGVEDDVDIISATFGKAFASMGAFAVSKRSIIDYITNKARSFIFSTALPPVNILWTNWILENKTELLQEKRTRLRDVFSCLLHYIKEKGMETPSQSQIIPIILGDNQKTVELADFLQEMGYFILPIRPPAVPLKTSRLRLSLNADLDFEELRKIVDIIAEKIK